MKKKIIALALCGTMVLSVPVYAKGGSVSISSAELQVPQSEKKSDKKESKKEKKNNDLSVVQSGWSVSTSEYSDDRHVNYGVKVTNSGSEKYGFVTLNIVVKDADGKIIKSEDYTISSIAAGDTVFAADRLNVGAYDPASVDFSLSYSDSDISQDLANDSSTSDFTLSNLSELPSEYGDTTITGEITSEAASDYSYVCITVLLEQDDTIVGGFYGYVDDVMSGETTAFEISDYDLPEHNNVEISAHASF